MIFQLLQGMDLRETLETLHPRFLGVPMVISCCRSMVIALYHVTIISVISNLIPQPWNVARIGQKFQHRHNRFMGKADACHITCHVCQVLEMILTSTFNFFALALWCSDCWESNGQRQSLCNSRLHVLAGWKSSDQVIGPGVRVDNPSGDANRRRHFNLLGSGEDKLNET